ARDELEAPLLERFIGVIYRPESEIASHYAQAQLARQFDAYLWFDRTSAVTPLTPDRGAGPGETWPLASSRAKDRLPHLHPVLGRKKKRFAGLDVEGGIPGIEIADGKGAVLSRCVAVG